MNVLLDFLPAALSGAAIGMAVFANHKLRVLWLMAHRREVVLGQLVGEAGEALMEGMEFKDFCALWDRHIVRFADEVHNQELHASDLWVRVPPPGQPWPDSEPAPVVMQ